MLSKNYFFILIASFFIAGFILLALPDKAYSEIGCCDNNNNDQCTPGLSDTSKAECEDAGGQPKTWIPDEACTGSPPMCQPIVGCCVKDPLPCDDGETADECSDGTWVPDTSCDDIEACQAPLGCCETTSGPAACTLTTDADCADSDTWMENVACNVNVCSGAGVTGCCSSDSRGCADGIEDGNCQAAGDTFVASLGPICNTADTCGQLGCCQGEGSCGDTNIADCEEGTWIPDDTCTESDICGSLIAGCCVFGKNDCSEISELQCGFEDGDFKGPDVECSGVPICNIVVSPIPTLRRGCRTRVIQGRLKSTTGPLGPSCFSPSICAIWNAIGAKQHASQRRL